jgi:hypothetical protein
MITKYGSILFSLLAAGFWFASALIGVPDKVPVVGPGGGIGVAVLKDLVLPLQRISALKCLCGLFRSNGGAITDHTISERA